MRRGALWAMSSVGGQRAIERCLVSLNDVHAEVRRPVCSSALRRDYERAQAIEKIEAATQHVKDLPLAASAPTERESLPIPVAASMPRPEVLPIPADAPTHSRQ
jgi:hypothetical protein